VGVRCPRLPTEPTPVDRDYWDQNPDVQWICFAAPLGAFDLKEPLPPLLPVEPPDPGLLAKMFADEGSEASGLPQFDGPPPPPSSTGD
jgi:hypothetical protein